MNPNDIDRVIDEAARSLSAGEPGAAFRATVIERMGARRWPFDSAYGKAMLLVPAAAAAIVIVAVWIAPDHRGASVIPPPPIASLRPDVALRAVPPVRKGHEDIAAVQRPNAPLRGLPDQTTHYVIDSTPLSELEPPPLTVPPIAMRRLGSGASIELDRLEGIAPLAIPRLDDSEGDHP
jgi:hypothetical protein